MIFSFAQGFLLLITSYVLCLCVIHPSVFAHILHIAYNINNQISHTQHTKVSFSFRFRQLFIVYYVLDIYRGRQQQQVHLENHTHIHTFIHRHWIRQTEQILDKFIDNSDLVICVLSMSNQQFTSSAKLKLILSIFNFVKVSFRYVFSVDIAL